MIDFTNMPTTKKAYAGANGGKIAVIYEGKQYTTPFISELQKTFYLTMLTERKEKILDKSLQLLRKREQSETMNGESDED